MPRSATWLLGLLGLLVLCVACVAFHAERIETDIETAARAALAEAGLGGDVAIAVSGRDVTVRADDQDTAATALALVQAVPGVRDIDGRVREPLPEGALGGPFALVPLASGGLALRGTVPDDPTRQRLLAAARAAFAGRIVRDGIAVDSAASGGWAGDVIAALPALQDVDAPGLAVLDGGALVLSGTAADAAARTAAEAAVREAVGSRTVRNEITAASPASGEAPGTDSGTDPDADSAADPDSDEADPGTAPEAPALSTAGRVNVENALPGDSEATGLAAALRQRLGRGSVRFQAGSDDLTPGSAEVLARAAAALQAHPEIAVELQAHTDAEGDDAANQLLSETRARAAKRVLVDAGADPEQILAAGYGETTPIADNSTEAGRAQNRRVAFKLLRRR